MSEKPKPKDKPTSAIPGTEAKIEVMAWRWENGLDLYADSDAKIPEEYQTVLAKPGNNHMTIREVEMQAALETLQREIPYWTAIIYGRLFQVQAYTKGEARAAMKRKLGLTRKQRLPIGTIIRPDASAG